MEEIHSAYTARVHFPSPIFACHSVGSAQLLGPADTLEE